MRHHIRVRDTGTDAETRIVNGDTFQLVEPIDRDETFGERRRPLPCGHHEVAATGDGTGSGGHRRQGLGERRGDLEAHSVPPSIVAQTLSAVIGSCRTGDPISFDRPFEIAAAVATFGASATGFAP